MSRHGRFCSGGLSQTCRLALVTSRNANLQIANWRFACLFVAACAEMGKVRNAVDLVKHFAIMAVKRGWVMHARGFVSRVLSN